MSDKNPSQAQQNTPPPPSGSSTKSKSDEQITKMETFFRELQKLEEKNVEAANRAIDESTRLWKESIAYGVKLSNEWRTLALKTTKQAAEMMSASFPS
jgi:hypothetical protein